MIIYFCTKNFDVLPFSLMFLLFLLFFELFFTMFLFLFPLCLLSSIIEIN